MTLINVTLGEIVDETPDEYVARDDADLTVRLPRNPGMPPLTRHQMVELVLYANPKPGERWGNNLPWQVLVANTATQRGDEDYARHETYFCLKEEPGKETRVPPNVLTAAKIYVLPPRKE